jgi:hypothetical protein
MFLFLLALAKLLFTFALFELEEDEEVEEVEGDFEEELEDEPDVFDFLDVFVSFGAVVEFFELWANETENVPIIAAIIKINILFMVQR